MEAPAKEEKVEDVIVKTNEGNIKSKVSRNSKLTWATLSYSLIHLCKNNKHENIHKSDA